MGSLPTRRVRIEFFDDVGTRHVLSVEGNLTRETISKILDYVELMAATGATAPGLGQVGRTKLERFTSLVLSRFSAASFVSRDAEEAFEQVYGERIRRSTVATYLSRLCARGLLSRVREGVPWRYSVRRSWSPFPGMQNQIQQNRSST